jgi:hypothetical protein
LPVSDGHAGVAAATWRSTRRRTASRLSRRLFGPGEQRVVGGPGAFVEHSMLVATFHVLDQRVPYVDLGADGFQERRPDAHARRLARQIEALGYRVTIEPAEAA